MQVTVSDDLAATARLAELSDREVQRAWVIGLFAEQRISLAQAAQLAGLDRAGFQRHLATRGIALAAGEQELPPPSGALMPTDKPWLALRGSAHYVGDPFAPVVSEDEIVVLQKAESDLGS